MKTVHIRHPKTGGEADVPASALPHHAAAGWQVADQASAPAEPKTSADRPEPAAAADQPANESEGDRPRRKTKE